jgi:phospholipid/cholesterol/gamma-HCH transport system substrate-binding protein
MALKVKNEVKIGIMVVVAAALLILGLNFLKGRGLFSSDKTYYTYFDDIQGLQNSASVRLNGFAIGKVNKIELQPDRKIKVSFQVSKDVPIPKSSVAHLASNDLISGTKIINMEMTGDSDYIAEGGFVESKGSEGLLDNLGTQAGPVIDAVKHTIESLDTLILTVNNIVNDDTRKNLNASFASLEVVLKQLSGVATQLNAQSGNLAGVISNANSITGNIANNNAQISNTLHNLESFSNNLKDAPIQQTLEDLKNAVANIQGIVAKVNENNGTLGMLINDKKLYNNLSETLNSLDHLLKDVKQSPAKYINVSVFGRKQKE